jgi:hypothetical protein
MQLVVEVEGEGEQAPLPGGGEALVALMSFSVVRGFGAQHPLIALADRLQAEHRVRLGPLTTFYEATIEDSEDAEKLEQAWQDAGELRDTLQGVATALRADPQAQVLVERASARDLPSQVTALLVPVAKAANEGKRVRLSYVL